MNQKQIDEIGGKKCYLIHDRIYVVPRPSVLCINIWRRLWESTRKVMLGLSQIFTSAVNLQKPTQRHRHRAPSLPPSLGL
ncbi:hypothetical protein DVH24_024211 [Malus domestica]|uniref:Uncharacterized protein n=1 Tax=Malus domestica TaxID=3750 RepID=A0A498JI82_MALDO|nr:hypothetical protein DVH24_024211 [Malus domestica]